MSYKFGGGNRIRFQMDRLCGQQPLMESYPFKFMLAQKREALLKDCHVMSNGQVTWNPVLRTNLMIVGSGPNGGDDSENPICLPQMGQPDCRRWRQENSGLF
uniref:Uncharacterized protein n=1 Tax=Nelumbo nucifera TaxID=4432 RepID=A0A822YL88_NELNU|nr:TPA_asm: hypothetical protein HUJ06_005574 [Nelumbo nucifera]